MIEPPPDLLAISRREPEELAAETGAPIQEAYALVLSAARIVMSYIDRAMPHDDATAYIEKSDD